MYQLDDISMSKCILSNNQKGYNYVLTIISFQYRLFKSSSFNCLFLSNHYANISSVVMQSVPRRSGFVTNEQNGQRSSCEACFALTSVKDEFDR